ncbi:Ref family recombination enhancement nuclease [Pontibacterium sp.]|uniref:Ref family recombination enhancement nuclease n=1 Tax=Pontibacterium sp. TaxID=2036026 RepID=UPI0035650834
MTKDEKQWLPDVADLGCVVCRNAGFGQSPAEIHHVRTGQGTAQRASNKQVLPLCPPHHRTGGYGVAFHSGQKAWEEQYGTETELLKQVESEVLEYRNSIIGRTA